VCNKRLVVAHAFPEPAFLRLMRIRKYVFLKLLDILFSFNILIFVKRPNEYKSHFPSKQAVKNINPKIKKQVHYGPCCLCYICLVVFCVPFGIKYAHALFVTIAKSDAFRGNYIHFWKQKTNALQTGGEKYKCED
jgi:hypothetical protein